MDSLKAIINLEEIKEMQSTINDLFVDDSIFDYIATLTLKSRNSEWLKSGISPRGAKAILRMTRSRAFLQKRNYVIPEDVLAVMPLTSCHRVTLSAKAKAAGKTEEEIIKEIMGLVPMPTVSAK